MHRVDFDLIITLDCLGLNQDLRPNLVLFDHFDELFIEIQGLEGQIVSQRNQVSVLVIETHLKLVVMLLNENHSVR